LGWVVESKLPPCLNWPKRQHQIIANVLLASPGISDMFNTQSNFERMMNMKVTLLVTLFASLLTVPVLAQNDAALQDQKQKVSYSIGVNIGNAWKRQDIEVDLDLAIRGIKDALGGGKTLLTDEEMRSVLTAYQTELRTKQQEKRKLLAEKNQKESLAFLEENKKQTGVIALPSGLQYKVLKDGTGPKPKTNDEVTVNYRGTLIDGTEFDSSEKNGKPGTFRVSAGGLIPGWIEGLQLMNVGSKWQLFIPSELAYGQFGRGLQIGPNATLIFDVELLSVKPQTNAPLSIITPGAPGNPTGPPNPVVSSDIIKVPSAEELKKGAKIEVIKAEDLEKLQKAEKSQKEPEKK
jgi:FKBP-type peptidyl-prolyl cis-trans isomerase FklB